MDDLHIAFRRAVETFDSVAAAATAIGCTRQNLSRSLDKGRSCPAGQVNSLAKATGISRSTLRPDLYPPEYETAPVAQTEELSVG